MKQPPILIIDDEDDIRKLLARIIKLEGYAVDQAATGKRGLQLLRQGKPYRVVICDVKLPDANGVQLLPQIKALAPRAEVILLTAFGTISDGVTAMKHGAFDYITKGDDNQRIIPLVSQATARAEQQYAEAESQETHTFAGIVGKSAPLQRAVKLAARVAATDTTVLLTGETGTGKEVFAQAIHTGSARADRPFVAINCSALGKDLLESEMFGHKAGAFTGATKDKKGLFEEADKGTIFLDELGEMDVLLQAKLLRVLESGTFLKVGETKETKVDVRIVAATNRDLEQEAADGNFRLDLYYRLSVFKIELPALRERAADIPLLAAHFIGLTTQRMGLEPLGMSDDFKQRLVAHAWKGNIRELKNVIERAVILTEGPELRADTLPYNFGDADGAPPGSDASFKLTALEKTHIRKVLAYTGGNKTRSAELLGIGLTTLYRKMEEYGIAK